MLLNSDGKDPSKSPWSIEPPALKHLSLKLTDPDFEPYASKEYVLQAGYMSLEGTTGADGKLEADIPESAEMAQILLFVEPRPNGKKIRYSIALTDPPDISTVPGALARLRNLGYYWGELTNTLNADGHRAVRHFQQDHEIEPTGDLDDKTRAALGDLHGH